MNFIKFYQDNIIKYDIVNKYNVETIDYLTNFKDIKITTKLLLTDMKKILSLILKMELLTLSSQQLNTKLNIKFSRGIYIYNFTLKNKKLEFFLFKYIWLHSHVFNKNNYSNNQRYRRSKNKISFSISSKHFKELDKFVHAGDPNLLHIQINLLHISKFKKQKSFILKSLKYF